MIINAKFRSKCLICGTQVNRGDRVEWTRGAKGVKHLECIDTAAAGNRDRCVYEIDPGEIAADRFCQEGGYNEY